MADEDSGTCALDCPPQQKPRIDLPSLELQVFDLVNNERAKNGLGALKWNPDIAAVARAHSAYLASQSNFTDMYISHLDKNGQFEDSRLDNAGIYYFNLSGENIFGENIIEEYYVNDSSEVRQEACDETEETISCFLGYSEGDITPLVYSNQSTIAADAVDGWMKSPGHRRNILTGEYTESGMGAATNPSGTIYILTQVFITRATCGYEDGICCEEPGYYPSCYIPLECVSGTCK